MAKPQRKQKSNAQERPDTEILIKGVLLLWPSFFEYPVIDGVVQDRYASKFLLDPEKHKDAINAIRKRMRTMAGFTFEDEERYEEDEDGDEVLVTVKADDLKAVKNLCLRRTSFKNESLAKGTLELQAKSKGKPWVLQPDGRTQFDEDEKDDATYGIWNGQIVDVKVDFWAIENKYGRTVSANLHAVRIVGGGERLTGGGMSQEEAIKGFDDTSDADLDFGDDDQEFDMDELDDDQPF